MFSGPDMYVTLASVVEGRRKQMTRVVQVGFRQSDVAEKEDVRTQGASKNWEE